MSSNYGHINIGHRPVGSVRPLAPKKKEKCCRCPACEGLDCLERPRYFAGQLLTEAELNSEQAYVIAKNRLHNRYLHGWGVVCGLAVVCSDCEGWVRIREGYALDPCGNDIIVCRETPFNLLEAIRKCIDARRRPVDECEPWRDPKDDCGDEEHWCITIAYREREAKPTMPLRQEKPDCDCGCGGGGCECGGGCGGKNKKNGGAKTTKHGCNTCEPARPASPKRPPACEPTRIVETFDIGVIPQPEACKDAHVAKKIDLRADFINIGPLAGNQPQAPFAAGSASSLFAAMLPPAFTQSPWFPLLVGARPEGTLLDEILSVWEDVRAFLAENMSKEDNAAVSQLLLAAMSGKLDAQAVAAVMPNQPASRDLCCRLRRIVQLLYTSNPFNVSCSGFDCPPCRPAQDDHFGVAALPANQYDVNAILCLIQALINYIIDAICMLLLPPCPPPQCDDRLILACVTVRDNKIIHICNFDCRHYAGSFNSLAYWTSAFPIWNLLAAHIRELCCSPDLRSRIFA